MKYLFIAMSVAYCVYCCFRWYLANKQEQVCDTCHFPNGDHDTECTGGWW